MRISIRSVAVLAVAMLLTACDSSSGPSEDSAFIGPCIHTVEDEVLHIDAATGTQTGAVIAALDLSGFTVDGQARTAQQIIEQRQINVVQFDGILRCTLPCAFGTEVGQWEFTASAVGYMPTLQSVAAIYDTFSGGCPSFETDGTHVSILLDE